MDSGINFFVSKSFCKKVYVLRYNVWFKFCSHNFQNNKNFSEVFIWLFT